MKKYFQNVDFMPLGYLILGVVLLFWPGLSTKAICMAVGGGLAIYGVFRIIWYFRSDKYNGLLRQDLTVGLVSFLLGLFLLWKPQMLASFLPVLFGVMLLVGAAGKLQMSLDFHRMGFAGWGWALAGAAVTAVLGGVLLLNPFESALFLVRFIGASLALDGAGSLVFGVMRNKTAKDFYQEP